MNKLEKFNSELFQDLESLKNWLRLSGKITSNRIVRQHFCHSIGIDIDDIDPENLYNLNDHIFIDTLFDYLSETDNKVGYFKINSILENCFSNSFQKLQKIKKIKRNLRLSEILTILEINNFTDSQIFDICNLSYKKCLLHKENKINISSKDLDKDLNNSVEILATLNNYQADENNLFSLLDFFVGYLKMNILKMNINDNHQFTELLESLDKWIVYYQNSADELINIIEQKQETINIRENHVHSLLIAIKPGNNLTIDSWFIEDINTYHHHHKNCRKINTKFSQELINNLTWENLERKFTELLDIVINTIDSTSEIRDIQLFLPYQYIIPVDKFLITREEEQYYLGAYYQISVRLLERITPATSLHEKDYQGRWTNKSNSLKNNIQQGKYNNLMDCFIGLDFLQRSSKELKNQLRIDHNFLAARLTCGLENYQTAEFMKILYFAGIPLALWVRKNSHNYEYETELCDIIRESHCLIKSQCSNTLSKLIQEKRLQADEERDHESDTHIGNHLYFLYDDADLVPPKEEVNHKLLIP